MIARAWYAWWIWLAYATHARRAWNAVLRWAIERRAERAQLVGLYTPAAVAKHLSGWHWRRDRARVLGVWLPLDYVSHPEVTEARLASGGDHGDCDDAHHYAATQLLRVDGVSAAYHVCIGYRGGGHLACVYQYRGTWWLLDYGRVTLVDSPQDAAAVLMRAAKRPDGEKPRWFFFEDVNLRRVRL